MMAKQDLSRLVAGAMALAVVAMLGGCSVPNAINPVAWYRDLSGASKNDALDKDKTNQKNLEAGGKEPYPNVGDVPDAPDQALSQAKRDELQKNLVADRDNAQYNDEQLRAGVAVPGEIAPAPPAPAESEPAAGTKPEAAASGPNAAAQPSPVAGAPAPVAKAAAVPVAPAAPPEPAPQKQVAPAAAPASAPQKQAAAVPQESALTPPSIARLPTGDVPEPPPPPPNLTRLANAASPAPPASAASSGSGQRRAALPNSAPVASIAFSDGSAVLTDKERNHLSEIAAQQHKEGGELQVIGHGEAAKSGTVAEQELASLKLALDRANAVAKMLSSEGVASQSIDVEAAPTPAGDTAAASTEVYLEH